jgi:Calcineurin-like phosphoesterase
MNSDSEPTAVIGDVHGDATRLLGALDLLASSGRRLIFVGDYINRGSESRAVLDTLSELKEHHGNRIVLLRGNHEATLLAWLSGGNMGAFLRHGGLSTVRSYEPQPEIGVLTQFPTRIPQAHHELLASTVPYYQDSELFVSHAGFDPQDPFSRSEKALVFGDHGCPLTFTQDAATPAPLVVFGHFVRPNRRPEERGGVICVDTGCGSLPGGPLTVLLLPERTYLQF